MASIKKRHLGVIIAPCLALALATFLLPLQAQAHTSSGAPNMQVSAGFETHYRSGDWVPVQIALQNNGPDFNGSISIDDTSNYSPYGNPGGNQVTPSHYRQPVTLANGAQKLVTIYVPIYSSMQSITIHLLDSNGNVVSTQTTSLNQLGASDVFVGVLTDQSTGFGPLSAVSLPVQGGSVIVEFLNAATMPSLTAALKNFNLIVLDNFTTSTLSPAQLNALQSWVDQGGSLVEVGGPEWRRTLSTLPPALLPFTITGTTTLPAGTPILPPGNPKTAFSGQSAVSDKAPSALTISTASLRADPAKTRTILTSGTALLMAQFQQDQGSISYLAFDPALAPITGWTGVGALWKGLLFRSMGDQLLTNPNFYPNGLYNGQSQMFLASRMNGLLQSLLPNTLPSPWLLVILLAGYILVLGPIRFLLVRHFKRRDWSWRIVVSSVVVFSLLTCGLAIQEKGTSILSNSISIVRLSRDNAPSHITTYTGVFAPNQGDFQVYVPGNDLVQPSPDPYAGDNSSPTIVTTTQGGTSVELQNVGFGTLHSVLSEEDRQFREGLTSHLAINNGMLVGTVTNTLGYTLNDAYLLMPNNVLSLGRLPAGQTKQVNLALNTTLPGPGITLADLIAQHSGSSYPYGAYPFNPGTQQPLTETQRHIAILLAIDGRGYFGIPCISCTGPLPIQPFSVPPVINKIAPALGQPVVGSVSYGSTILVNNVSISTSSFSSSVLVSSFSGGPFSSLGGENDPLLVHGAPATLIGWADKPLDATAGTTVNNISPTGLHETLIQAPLDVSLAGTLSLPPYFISGNLIDVQGNNVQSQFPDVYAMTTGSMTFEFTIPAFTNLQISGLGISEPNNVYLTGQGGTPQGESTPQLHLYNWHTGSWDAISLNQNSFTTTNASAYIGPGGRVLLQAANQNSSAGTLFFSKPSLNLQGVASGS